MKRRDWFVVLTPLLATWLVDRFSKIWATSAALPFDIGPMGLMVHHNHGAALGLFSDLPAVLRIVTLSTGGAFLVFAFGLIQYLLPIRSLMLRSGLSVLLGGILGNVADRIFYGYVIDFIYFRLGASTVSPVFNVADALQWVGYGMLAFALIKEGQVLWPEGDVRRLRWVNARFQLRYCFLLTGIGIGLAIISGVYAYTFLRVAIIDLVGNNPHLLNHYLVPFIATYVVITLLFAGILFLAGRSISQRIAGPMYAFEKYLDDLVAGKPRALRLRAGDEFRHLEKLAERLNAEMAKRYPNQAPPAPEITEK